MAAVLVMPRWLWLFSAVLLILLPCCECAAARLYTEQDPLVILTRDTLRATLTDSSSAWLVQFYSSWCGHCIQYSSTWKALARDVRDWQGAISVAVFDCALEENFDLCRDYGIKFYPTFKVKVLQNSTEYWLANMYIIIIVEVTVVQLNTLF
uniref:Thioredoxin domain-containing protein n=1 Tax=Periophthalmus magnuspinnatus TaxID=409849 RepID=A0A3B4B9R0_9GOBI